MKKRHFIIYYDSRVREIIRTTPRTWAKANQGHFPAYDFIENHPTDQTIENYILQNFDGFSVAEENEEPHKFKILYNFETQIPVSPLNGRNFIL